MKKGTEIFKDGGLFLDKPSLRKSAVQLLERFSENEKLQIEKQFLNHLLASELWVNAKTIGITISRGFEWNTKPVIENGWQAGKTICVPKCHPSVKKLTFHHLTDFDHLEVEFYNLLEPNPLKAQQVKKSSIDLLIVPGLLFDKQGYRIGFGGGYYDRFLVDFPNETLSFVHSSQLINEIPSEPFDVPVKHVLTEQGFIK